MAIDQSPIQNVNSRPSLQLNPLKRQEHAAIDKLDPANPIISMNARNPCPMFRRDGFQNSLRIVIFRNLCNLNEGHAVAIGRSTTLAGSNQPVKMAKKAACPAVRADIRRDRICRMKMPVSSERRRVKQQQR